MNQNDLHKLLEYDPLTGVFKWRTVTGSGAPGKAAGCVCGDGYVRIRVMGTLYLASRLAWFYMIGKWPSETIDHVDLDKSNNAWINLREASYSQNQMNSRRQVNNKSGYKGVHFCNTLDKWIAKITVNGKVKHLGSFKTLEEAGAAREKWVFFYHHDFGRIS